MNRSFLRIFCGIVMVLFALWFSVVRISESAPAEGVFAVMADGVSDGEEGGLSGELNGDFDDFTENDPDDNLEDSPDPEPLERIYLTTPKPYYNRAGGIRLGFLRPQGAYILANLRGDWVRLLTDCGVRVVDMGFEAPLWELAEYISQFNVSVFFENMATGFTFEQDADRRFFGASATKAPFAFYIYTKAAAGETDLDSVHTFLAGDYWHGSGFIRRQYEPGATFSQRRLLHLMLSPSDNIATRILRRIHGLTGYREFMYSIGANPDFVQNLTYSYLSAREAGIFLGAAYRFIETDCPYAAEFAENMLANRYPFIISDYPVASKSGWAYNFGGAYHDMAIVFADSPYTLAILSNKDGTHADRRIFERISMRVQEFNTHFYLGSTETEGLVLGNIEE